MSNVRRLARNISVDISADGAAWLNLPARVDNAPALTPNKVDSTDVDTDGFTSMEITLVSGVLTIKYNSLIDGGTPNAAQQMVENCEGKFGDQARLFVRWYDNDGGSNGHTAHSIVEVARGATGVADLRSITATFTLDGTITPMSPSDITAALGNADNPTVLSATPSGAAAGSQVTITGQHFTGVVPATGVKFGAVTATVTTVVSDSTIVAVMPAGTAGPANVVVTNVAGASNALAYTRGA